jgi:uncharacterized membrane protein YoaK (UPF0700 family)
VPSGEQKKEAHIFYMAALIRGFLGLFPIVSIVKNFGSAQTANMIEIIVAALEKNKINFSFYITGTFLYSMSIVFVTVLKRKSKTGIKFAALGINIIAVLAMCILPENLSPLIYLYPTFLAMPFLWCTFNGGYGFTSSPIFSTNNLRMFISSLVEIFIYKEKSFMLKAKFFGATLLFFHTGIVLSWICWHFFKKTGFLFALVPILLCSVMIIKNEIMKKRHNIAIRKTIVSEQL